MSDSKFLRGTLIVTLGTFLVKFLGMIYVFPFHALVGTEGERSYIGYIPYTIFKYRNGRCATCCFKICFQI